MKNNEKGIVLVSFVNEVVMCVCVYGVDMQFIMVVVGIMLQMLVQLCSCVLFVQYGVLWVGIVQVMDDEFFGQDVYFMCWGSFVVMMQVVFIVCMGWQVLVCVMGFLWLVLDDLYVCVEEDDQCVCFVFVYCKGMWVLFMFIYVMWFIMVYGLVCWLVGWCILFIVVCFCCVVLQDVQEYCLMFCDDMVFKYDVLYVDLLLDFFDLLVI